MTKLPMNIIAAVDTCFGIGRNNDLPWHLPKEYAHFVRLTKTTQDPEKINAVIMGRKCWESIPEKFRPLKNRLNIVLSRNLEPMISDQLIIANDFDQALDLISNEPFKDKIETLWNVGGSDVYEIGLKHPQLHKLILTKINQDFKCDVKFPSVNWDEFEINTDFTEEATEENGVSWIITSYSRKAFAIK